MKTKKPTTAKAPSPYDYMIEGRRLGVLTGRELRELAEVGETEGEVRVEVERAHLRSPSVAVITSGPWVRSPEQGRQRPASVAHRTAVSRNRSIVVFSHPPASGP
jgi:hypothetical protein